MCACEHLCELRAARDMFPCAREAYDWVCARREQWAAWGVITHPPRVVLCDILPASRTLYRAEPCLSVL